MKFKPGDPKPVNSGRRKGVKNRVKLQDVAVTMAEKDIDPVAYILEAMQGLELVDRIGIMFQLMKYTHAPLKPKEPESDELKQAPISVDSGELKMLLQKAKDDK